MKELQELRNEVLSLRNMGEITKQTESILLHKLNALKAAINYTHSCTELKEKKALTFEGWLKDNDKQYIYDDFIEGSFTYSMGSWYREYLKDVK